MITKILCPLDGSDPARKALGFAVDIAKKYDASLVLVHAILRKGDFSGFQQFAKIEGLADHVEPNITQLAAEYGRLDIISEYDDSAVSSRVLLEIGQQILDSAKLTAERNGVKSVSTLLVDGDPANQILHCIDEHDIDCVVMGSRGLGNIKSLLLGSVSHKVANKAPCTCIAVK